ncbi:MAG: DUF434 domain-containing protein [Paraclostridium sordellii]|uniref:DUF434 domain-containing protein n=1 Tax=Paraclostridium sordellii TaxID=1505 RepID=UPI00214A101F|nr:DUF434 domain-containing protein [Paeniclostridium sordellii]MCR1847993.1 DUF434 domain-containing protein [Paeniclostridium sordellii]MDU2148080.1 DUF434 domain-containing protein [Paeniclostridium sordellii]
MSKITRRGYDENDKKWFSNKELIKLKKAKEEVEWLINRDYKIDNVVNFVCNRYQFSNRQRDCIKRIVCSDEKKERRKNKELSIDKISEGPIYIDGFNTIITIEVALSKGTLIIGSDKNIRDLAGLRGTYKIIDKTVEALTIIGNFLDKNNCESAVFYLDAPVSNSGNLKHKIIESFKQRKVDVNVELVNNPDIILEKLDRVISSDAIIIDKCISYFNMTKSIIEEYIQDANIVNLND